MDFWTIITIIDLILFAIVALTVLYMAVFAIASLFNKHSNVPKSERRNRMIVLIPAYKNDDTILATVKSILGQTYPQRLFDVVVISDHQSEITNFMLAQQPITLLKPDFHNSAKARSLQYAMNNIPQFKLYDIVVVLDAGNIVLPEFLENLNNAYEVAGTKAIQTHRLSKNRDTASAIMDATFEEINNSIFRRGHVNLGLSSAIRGTGIAFDFNWFKENIVNCTTTWEDKELEAMLMRQHIFVDYFDNIWVFDEKTRRTADFHEQRTRWASTQFYAILSNIRYLPGAILNRHYDLIDKILQWIIIPRTILMGIILIMSCILPFVYLTLAIKWWITAAFILLIFAVCTPDYLIDKNWSHAFLKAPFLMLGSVLRMPLLPFVRFMSRNKDKK